MTINLPFDMQRTGALISRLRKQHNMTQMQLADALGISFQAVSNWERGLSMPDISKLPELAELFGTTIDELLGRRCPVIEQAAAGQLLIHLENAEVSLSEAIEAAPLLPPDQAEALAAHVADSLPPEKSLDLSALLPFMSTSQIDKLLQQRLGAGDYAMLLPFCSTGAIDAAAQARLESGQSIVPLLPFMSNPALRSAWDALLARGESAAEFLPFLPTADVDRIAIERSEKGEDFSEYLPFLSSGALMRILRQRVQKGQSVTMLLPFLPASAIDQLAKAFTDE